MEECLQNLKYRYLIFGIIAILIFLPLLFLFTPPPFDVDFGTPFAVSIGIYIFPMCWLYRGMKKYGQSIFSWYSKVLIRPSKVISYSALLAVLSIGLSCLLVSTTFPFLNQKILIEVTQETRSSYTVLSFIETLVIIPICDETIFRGFFLQKLMTEHTQKYSIIVSSIVFTVCNIGSAVSYFVMGVVLSIIYLKSRSLVPCVLVHFIFNLIIYCSDLLFLHFVPANMLTNPPVAPLIALSLVAIVISLGWVVVFIKKNKMMFYPNLNNIE